MQINVNGNSLKKLVRLLRSLADELEKLCDENSLKSKSSNLELVKKDNPKTSKLKESANLIVEHYAKIHPHREKGIGPKHKSYKLVMKRLTEGYSYDDLIKAIDNNSKKDWWVLHNRHSINDIFGKNGNLDSFIAFTENKKDKDAKRGYSSGSKQFSKSLKGFGD
tara:strand:- start:4886 stop:5380 length:495 start_codon:yes stop_codon:yes gene_type:complete